MDHHKEGKSNRRERKVELEKNLLADRMGNQSRMFQNPKLIIHSLWPTGYSLLKIRKGTVLKEGKTPDHHLRKG